LAREIIGIQYLRGLAALAVVLDHAAATVSSRRYFGEAVPQELAAGVVGVDLFFLISGFIITIVSLDRHWNPTINWRKFFANRFVRIVPLMWVAILSYGALRFIGRGEADVASLLRAFFLSPVGLLEPLHIWTLRHEAIFYAVFALSMLGPRWMRPLLVVWVLAPIVAAFGDFPELVEKIAYPTNVEFGLGVLVGLFWLKRPMTVRLPCPPLLTLGAMVLLIAATAAVGHHFHLLENTVVVGLLCLPVLLLGVFAECSPGRLDRLFYLLGTASYSIYLFHPHLLSGAALAWAKLAPNTPAWIAVPGLFMAAALGGLLAYWLIEKPLVAGVKTVLRPKASLAT
jgi:exopolysaccharide production protein ExoZ